MQNLYNVPGRQRKGAKSVGRSRYVGTEREHGPGHNLVVTGMGEPGSAQ